MSLDLEVWSVEPFTSPEHLPEPASWQLSTGGWTFRQNSWQLVLGSPIEIDDGDIPKEIGPRLVGIRYFSHVTLEPGHAGKAAEAFQKKVGRAVAKLCRGVVYDPRTGEVHGSTRASKFVLATAKEPIAALTLSWWFLDGPLLRDEGVIDLVRYFARHLPQFAPRRYGDFEPPRFRFDFDDIHHFVDMALNTRLVFVWAARSLFDVSFRPNYGPGWRPLATGTGYCVPHLSLSCPADFLADQGMYQALRNCWEFVTKLAQPIYGDVRILSGYLRRGSRLAAIAGDPPDPHPVLGPWRGLPQTLGLAIALGDPYFGLWPGMKTHSVGKSLAMATLPDWRNLGSVSDVVGPPPELLCQPGDPVVRRKSHTTLDGTIIRHGQLIRPTGLAAAWPFSPPPPDWS